MSVISTHLFFIGLVAILISFQHNNGASATPSSSKVEGDASKICPSSDAANIANDECSSILSTTMDTRMNEDDIVPKRGLKNSAFVFIKPHANTVETQKLVKSKLLDAGIEIISETEITGDIIDSKKLVDQHYYAIASKATILKPKDIPVPEDKFESSFGESWSAVQKEQRAYNALDACSYFECTPKELNEAWSKAKVSKFGGGFYCGLLSINEKPAVYVFNGFFMTMRSKYVGIDKSIHCYVTQWDSNNLSWSRFRNEFIGPTDPVDGPRNSIRRTILKQYKQLGLAEKPNKGDNGVHASASPFEGLVEKMNWLNTPIKDDNFGRSLLESGISKRTITQWSVDPIIKISEEGNMDRSIFDTLEDLDANDCLKRCVELNRLNNNK